MVKLILAIFDIINYALHNFNLLWNINLLVNTFLLCCVRALLVMDIGALGLILHVVGHGNRYPVTLVFRYIIAHITSLFDIFTYLRESWFADFFLMSFTLNISHYL